MSINYGHRPGAGTPVQRCDSNSPLDVRTPGEVGTSNRALKEQQAEAPILPLGDQLRKAFTTRQAQFARLGHTLTFCVRDDGHVSYLVARWGQNRYFDRLADVDAFLVQIGGRP